jgi:hypothetical protein
MPTLAYEHRVARGLCPRCASPSRPGRVCCVQCADAMRDRIRTPRHTVTPGYAIACCGRFRAFTTIPVTTACCGKTYFQEDTP